MPPTPAPPAPTPTPAAKPAIPTAPEPAPSDFMAEQESAFADMDAGKTPAPRGRDDKGKFQPAAKPAEKAAEKPVGKPPEKPAGSDTEAEKPAESPIETSRPLITRELGAAYDTLKKRVKEDLEPQLQSLKAKVQAFESKKPEDTGPVLAKLTALEKRNAELEKHMEYVDFQQSKTFKEKYDEPFTRAWNDAVATFQQLTVSKKSDDGVDDMGEAKFKIEKRPATTDDLQRLAGLPLQEMYDQVDELFGKAGPEVIGQIRDLRKLFAAKEQAKEEAKTKAEEWRSQRDLEFRDQAKARVNLWVKDNADLREKFPKAFEAEEGNAEDKAAHTKGFALANLKFIGAENMPPEQIEALPNWLKDTVISKKPLSMEQQVQLDAIISLRIANHDRLIEGKKKDRARIAELEKALAEYEASAPDAAKAGTSDKAGNKDFMTTFEEGLEKLNR